MQNAEKKKTQNADMGSKRGSKHTLRLSKRNDRAKGMGLPPYFSDESISLLKSPIKY